MSPLEDWLTAEAVSTVKVHAGVDAGRRRDKGSRPLQARWPDALPETATSSVRLPSGLARAAALGRYRS